MSEKIGIITLTREDLIDVSETLMRALDPELLADPGAPITFAVNGSRGSGKKIFADIGCAVLFETAKNYARGGITGEDEYHTGEVDGIMREVDFIDIAWGYLSKWKLSYSSDDIKRFKYPADIEAAFMSKRSHGGATFIQNRSFVADESPRGLILRHQDRASVDIWLEKRGVGTPYNEASRAHSSPMREAFAIAAWPWSNKSSWTRYVEIEINGASLQASALFQQALSDLSKGAKEVEAMIKAGRARDPAVRPYRKGISNAR